jgi:hypothetical protein
MLRIRIFDALLMEMQATWCHMVPHGATWCHMVPGWWKSLQLWPC